MPSTSGLKRSISSSSTDSPLKKHKQDFQVEEGYVVVYVDGACENNGRHGARAGIGAWFGDDHPL